jgi:hypothetical protein
VISKESQIIKNLNLTDVKGKPPAGGGDWRIPVSIRLVGESGVQLGE